MYEVTRPSRRSDTNIMMRLLLILALWAAVSVRSQPIRHHILIRLPDNSAEPKAFLLNIFREAAKGIAGIQHAEFGIQDTEITDSRSSTLGGFLDFASAADYHTYARTESNLLIQLPPDSLATLQTSPDQIKDSSISPYTIRHHILLKLKSDTSQADKEALLVGLRGMQQTIGVIKHAEFGLQSTAINDTRSSTVGGFLEFESVADYETYADHADHKALIQNLILPFIALNGRAALQTNIAQPIRHHILVRLKPDASQAEKKALLAQLQLLKHSFRIQHAEFGLQNTQIADPRSSTVGGFLDFASLLDYEEFEFNIYPYYLKLIGSIKIPEDVAILSTTIDNVRLSSINPNVIRHHILIKIKSDTSESDKARLLAGLRGMQQTIGVIKHAEFGLQIINKRHSLLDDSYSTVGGFLEFESVADYETYADHADHKALIQNLILPFIALNGRAALQTNIAPLIRHHILVKLKPDTSQADKKALLEGLRGMQKDIAVMQHAEFGLQDNEITDSRSSTVGGIVDFASVADYQVYAQHPKHLELIQNLVLPFIADGGRCGLQTRLAYIDGSKRQQCASLPCTACNKTNATDETADQTYAGNADQTYAGNGVMDVNDTSSTSVIIGLSVSLGLSMLANIYFVYQYCLSKRPFGELPQPGEKKNRRQTNQIFNPVYPAIGISEGSNEVGEHIELVMEGQKPRIK